MVAPATPLMPSSYPTEAALLGAVMQWPDLIDELDLEPRLWWRDDHRALFALIRDMRLAGETVDLVTIPERAAKRNWDLGYILSLTSCAPTRGAANGYAATLRELAERRRLVQEAEQLTRVARDEARPIEVVRDAARSIGVEQDSNWPEPAPVRAVVALPEFPLWTLPSAFADYGAALAIETQTPTCLVGMVMLSAMSAAVAGKVCVRVEGNWREPVNIYTVAALPPGSRKSAVFRPVTEPIEQWEMEEHARMAPAIAERAMARDILNEKVKAAKRKALKAHEAGNETGAMDAETEALELAKELEQVPPIEFRGFVAQDVTQERMVGMMQANGGVLYLADSEGGLFGMMAGRYAKQGGVNLDVYLKGHAGDPIRVDRMGRASEYVPRPCLVMGLTIQPEVIARMAEDQAFRGRGMIARFLFAIPKDRVGYRQVDPPYAPPHLQDEYRGAMREMLQIERRLDTKGRIDPRQMELSPGALRLLRAFQEEVEVEMRSGGRLEGVKDWGSKLPGAVVRVAGILACARATKWSPPWGHPIDERTMEAAIAIGHYLIPHALAAHDLLEVSQDAKVAWRILDWIERNGLAEFSARDCLRAIGSGEVRRASDLESPIGLLCERGWIRPIEQPRKPGVRAPSPRFLVSPFARA